MSEDADSESAANDGRADLGENETPAGAQKPPRSDVRWALAVGAVAVVGLAGLVGWHGYCALQSHQAEQQRDLFLRVGRQSALDLTTISYTEVEADVQRILDSSIGTFHDDFQKRSRPFVELVKRDQSNTEGSVTQAGLQSVTGDSARVLVAISMKTSNAGVAEQQQHGFRMRIDVERVGDRAKVSYVEFIP